MEKIARHRTRHGEDAALNAHRHAHAYAALILRGGYVETGADGAWRCEAGELVVHPPFHLHADRFASGGATVLNFTLPFDVAASLGASSYFVLRPKRPENVERRRDGLDALLEAFEDGERVASAPGTDWRDALGAALQADPRADIADMSRQSGVSPEHAARSFHRRFGLKPAAFRAEQKLRMALRLLTEGPDMLADIALDAGYADQAHMSRALKAATGKTPKELRRLLAPHQFGSR